MLQEKPNDALRSLERRTLVVAILATGLCAGSCKQDSSVRPFDFSTRTETGVPIDSGHIDATDSTVDTAPKCLPGSDTGVDAPDATDTGCRRTWLDDEGDENCCSEVKYGCGAFNFPNWETPRVPGNWFVEETMTFHIGYHAPFIDIVDVRLTAVARPEGEETSTDTIVAEGTSTNEFGPAYTFDLSETDAGGNDVIVLKSIRYTDACGVTTELDIRKTIQPNGNLTGDQFFECEAEWSCRLKFNEGRSQ